jgi:hypothetical protein
MDTQTHENTYNIDGDRVPPHTSEAQFKDAMRYRKLKFFVDTLVIMDKNKGAMHFEKYEDLDAYIDSLAITSKSLLTPASIATHALRILEDQLTMTHKENRK